MLFVLHYRSGHDFNVAKLHAFIMFIIAVAVLAADSGVKCTMFSLYTLYTLYKCTIAFTQTAKMSQDLSQICALVKQSMNK